tara:strand:- start:6132 stop:6761 length:630 start_codon:yes stop_codon:yes gene_type:complete
MNKLILLRHGQSKWNLENKFTGLKDIPLSQNGEDEAKKAGLLIKNHKIKIDKVFSSTLQRANKTAEIALKEAELFNLFDEGKLVMTKNSNLNERDYGDLVGLNKEETAKKFGKQQVHLWRRSFEIRPPNGESLKDVYDRVSPYYDNFIFPNIKSNKNIIIVAHGNSLRATMIKIGLYRAQNISSIELPTGLPFCIVFNNEKISEFFYLK